MNSYANVLLDNDINSLAHFGVKGMSWYSHQFGKWQPQAVYAGGQPDPNAKVRTKSSNKKKALAIGGAVAAGVVAVALAKHVSGSTGVSVSNLGKGRFRRTMSSSIPNDYREMYENSRNLFRDVLNSY